MVIEWFMFGALGFFLGCLLALMLAPPLWNRAVRLTTRRLEATMPMTLADIQADKDQQRADFAIQLRKVEVALEKAKEKGARELIEANKRRVEIQLLTEELQTAKGDLQENENANRVLQQTIKRRLPDLDARLKGAKKALAELETVNAELRNTVASQSDALKVARNTVQSQRADIDRLREALESSSTKGRGKSGRGSAEAQRLAAELSRTQEELEHTKIETAEINALRRELNTLAGQIIGIARSGAPMRTAQIMQEDVSVEDERSTLMSNGAGAPESGEPEPVMEQIERAVEAAEAQGAEAHAPEMEYADAAHDANGAGTHAEDVHAEDAHAAEADGAAEDTPQKTTLAQRFAARRAKRSEGKSGGGSLTSRLRNLGR